MTAETLIIEPNLKQLQNALDQTHGADRFVADNWKADLMAQVRSMDCKVLSEDVKNFLEHPQESALLTEQNICAVLK